MSQFSEVVATEMSSCGHVYVRRLTKHEFKFFPPSYSDKPGSLEAVGSWSYYASMPEHHAIEKGVCSCLEPPVLHDPTFLCPGCNRRVGYCLGCCDDEPDLCTECWCAKQED